MTDQNLRKKLIRLAHTNPEFRKEILPLLQGRGKQASLITYANPIKVRANELVKVIQTSKDPESDVPSAFMHLLWACAHFAKMGLKDSVLSRLITKAEEHVEATIPNYPDDEPPDDYGTEPYEVSHGPREW